MNFEADSASMSESLYIKATEPPRKATKNATVIIKRCFNNCGLWLPQVKTKVLVTSAPVSAMCGREHRPRFISSLPLPYPFDTPFVTGMGLVV